MVSFGLLCLVPCMFSVRLLQITRRCEMGEGEGEECAFGE